MKVRPPSAYCLYCPDICVSASTATETMPVQWMCLLKKISAASVLASLVACANPSGIAPEATLRTPQSVGLTQSAAQWVPPDWWTQWGDTQLNALIAQALHDNPTLHIASARVRQAQAQTRLAQAARGPQNQVQADVMRQHYTATGLVPAPIAGSVQDTGTLQLAAGWEPDLFGRQRAALEAAIGMARAAQADAQAARLLLATQIVRQYIQLTALQAQKAVVQRTYDQRNEILVLVQDRLRAGLDTELELRQSEGALPQSRQQLLALQEQMDLTRNALAALVGQPALAQSITPVPLDQLPVLSLPGVLPLDLLGRRADIVAARWRVQAAQHDITQAKALFYPNVNLSAFLGLSSLGLSNLIQADSRQWGLGSAISLPLFDSGRLRANLQARTTAYDEAVEQYNALLVQAVHEVSDPLVSLRAIATQQYEQQQAQTAAQQAYAIAQARYQAGLANYLQVLSVENAVLQQRMQAVELSARMLDAHAQLAHALGGGYEAEAVSAQLVTH